MEYKDGLYDTDFKNWQLNPNVKEAMTMAKSLVKYGKNVALTKKGGE